MRSKRCEAIEINSETYEAYCYLGNVWLARGDLDKAQAQYEESLKFANVFTDALYGLRIVYFRKGETDRALEQFEKVLRYSPKHADADFWRAIIRSERRQFGDAAAELKKKERVEETRERARRMRDKAETERTKP